MGREHQVSVVEVQTPEHGTDEHAEWQDDDVEGLVPEWFPLFHEAVVGGQAAAEVVGDL